MISIIVAKSITIELLVVDFLIITTTIPGGKFCSNTYSKFAIRSTTNLNPSCNCHERSVKMTNVSIRIIEETCKEERHYKGNKPNHEIFEPIRMICIDTDADKETECTDNSNDYRKYGSEFFHFDVSSVKK